ncbi:TFIIB-type zinc ribbon-containing protein [Oerskovia paurometabola]|uniref:TFIIB-type zinc ribbon-containing protein n=1 Tax=Oerskovia paurometabola TaxID=162170 RepID=A0ABW1X8U9_9CELL|nr:TFIIB-type zinc ribbon-containing protein [Oerskovia paurometabola]MBM7499024.1 ribosomal protein S27E [Oerskovia paurometabola]
MTVHEPQSAPVPEGPPPPGAGPTTNAGPPSAGGPTGGPTVVRTDTGATDGLVKCIRCGATEIAYDVAKATLRCGFCRYEWVSTVTLADLGLDGNIGGLEGVVLGSGSADIVPSAEEILTFRCAGCGADVVVDTAHGTQARCHWCRNVLSVNQQVPNGAVPDVLLPFRLPKEDAVVGIRQFVGRRQFYAHPRFRAEFSPENVVGVYLPYLVADLNAKARLEGQGEHLVRRYTVTVRGSDGKDTTETRYDYDLYDVVREFDLHVDDLTIESSADRRDHGGKARTNNVINTILPFDVENAVRYDSNYLSGFTAERRDSDVDDLRDPAFAQAKEIARFRARDMIDFYDRGVRWDRERLDVVGQRWVAAYLPVWLYSYHEVRKNGSSLLHYVAVNGRTGETMGSVPVNHRRLLAVSVVVEAVAAVAALFVMIGF